MNGGLTHQEMEIRKRKAEVLDELREWLRGRAQSEEAVEIQRRIESAYDAES